MLIGFWGLADKKGRRFCRGSDSFFGLVRGERMERGEHVLEEGALEKHFRSLAQKGRGERREIGSGEYSLSLVKGFRKEKESLRRRKPEGAKLE